MLLVLFGGIAILGRRLSATPLGCYNKIKILYGNYR